VVMAENYIVGQPSGRYEGEAAHYEPGPEQLRTILGLNDDINKEPDKSGGERPEDAEDRFYNGCHIKDFIDLIFVLNLLISFSFFSFIDFISSLDLINFATSIAIFRIVFLVAVESSILTCIDSVIFTLQRDFYPLIIAFPLFPAILISNSPVLYPHLL